MGRRRKPPKEEVMNDASKRSPGHANHAILLWLRRGLPTMVLVCVLGTVAAWGHYTSWKFPSLSDLTGKAAPEKEDWCAQHSVPESLCVECNESLMPKTKATWCRKHGVFNCPFEYPEGA